MIEFFILLQFFHIDSQLHLLYVQCGSKTSTRFIFERFLIASAQSR